MGFILQITMALYSVGLLNSLLGFYRKRQFFIRTAIILVVCGFITHTMVLVQIVIQKRHFPISNLPESLCFFAWCITITFIIASFRYQVSALGAFVLPLVSALVVLSSIVWQEDYSIPPLLRSNWVYLHSSVAFLAYASFFLTFISGVLYLIQEKELKKKSFRFFYFRLPSLQACDELLRRSMIVGFILMSVTIVTGAIWAEQAWGRFWSWDPKETTALITWGIYLILIQYRLSARWRGRWAAYISIVGFVSALLTFSISWFTGLHIHF